MPGSIRQQFREAIGFYSNDDLVRCAAQLVRLLGISGSLGLIQAINKLLQSLQALRSVLSMLQSIMGQIQSLGSFVFGLDFVKNMVMQQLSRINACPLLLNLVWREANRLGFGTNFQLFDWWKDKVSFLNKVSSDVQDELDEAIKVLTELQELIQLAQDSLTISKPGFGGIDTGSGFGGQGKMLKDLLKLEFKKEDLPKISPFEASALPSVAVEQQLGRFSVRDSFYHFYDKSCYLHTSIDLKDLQRQYSWVSVSMDCEPFISFGDWVVDVRGLHAGGSGLVSMKSMTGTEETPGQLTLFAVSSRSYLGVVVLNHRFEPSKGALFDTSYMNNRQIELGGVIYTVANLSMSLPMVQKQGNYYYLCSGAMLDNKSHGGFIWGFLAIVYDLDFNFVSSMFLSTSFGGARQLPNGKYVGHMFSEYKLVTPGQNQYDYCKALSGYIWNVSSYFTYQGGVRPIHGGRDFSSPQRPVLIFPSPDGALESYCVFYFGHLDCNQCVDQIVPGVNSFVVLVTAETSYQNAKYLLCKFSGFPPQLEVAKELVFDNTSLMGKINVLSDDTGPYFCWVRGDVHYIAKFDWDLNYLWGKSYYGLVNGACLFNWRGQIFTVNTSSEPDAQRFSRMDCSDGTMDDCPGWLAPLRILPLVDVIDRTSNFVLVMRNLGSPSNVSYGTSDDIIVPKYADKTITRQVFC